MRYMLISLLLIVLAACDVKDQLPAAPNPDPIPAPAPDPVPTEPTPEPVFGGTLDESFGNAGKVVFFDGDEFSLMAMAAQADGKIVTLTTLVQ
jgi:hypothetical protein